MFDHHVIDVSLVLTQRAQYRRRDPFNQIADVALRHISSFHGVFRGRDGAAVVVSEDNDQRHMEHRDAVFERAENGVINNMSGGTHDENVTKADVENDLRRKPGVRAAEDDCERILGVHQFAGLHCAAPKVLIGVSSPTSATGIQRALQESLWALGSANGNAMNLVRYADGPSWLGLTSFEEGTALVQRLLGPIFMTETSTLTQLWFALQIHEAMHN